MEADRLPQGYKLIGQRCDDAPVVKAAVRVLGRDPPRKSVRYVSCIYIKEDGKYMYKFKVSPTSKRIRLLWVRDIVLEGPSPVLPKTLPRPAESITIAPIAASSSLTELIEQPNEKDPATHVHVPL